MSTDITDMINRMRLVEITSDETIAIASKIVDHSLYSRDIAPIVVDVNASYQIFKIPNSVVHFILINAVVLIKISHFNVYDAEEMDDEIKALVTDIAIDTLDQEWFMVAGNSGMEVVHEIMGVSPTYIDSIQYDTTIKDKIEIQNIRRIQAGPYDPSWTVEYRNINTGTVSNKLVNYDQVEERLVYDAKQNIRKQVQKV